MKKSMQKLSMFAGFVTGSLALMHMYNKFIFLTSMKKEALYRCNQQYYSWRFGKIAYTKRGSGSPLLLVHDLSNTGSNYEFKELERILSETHTVYSIDLIGCGQSSKPNIIYTNYLYVQLLHDFIENIIQDKPVLVTSRSSSAIGVMSSYINSNQIEKLVLINPSDLKTLNKYPKQKHKLLKWCFELPIVGTFLYNQMATKAVVAKKFNTDYLYGNKPLSHYKAAFYEAAHISGASSKYLYTSVRCHYTNTNIIHALKGISTPICILQGESSSNSDSIAIQYETLCPAIENIVVIPNTAGMPHIEKPSSCAEAIEDFL